MILNSPHAMSEVIINGSENKGTTKISAHCHDNFIKIYISDTNPEIAEDISYQEFLTSSLQPKRLVKTQAKSLLSHIK